MTDLEKLDRMLEWIRGAKDLDIETVTIPIDLFRALVEVFDSVYRPRIIARSSNGDVKTTYLDEVFRGTK